MFLFSCGTVLFGRVSGGIHSSYREVNQDYIRSKQSFCCCFFKKKYNNNNLVHIEVSEHERFASPYGEIQYSKMPQIPIGSYKNSFRIESFL